MTLPETIDLSKYLHFIRSQTGDGCWAYADAAVWDIMNEMACPYSPNLSVRLHLWLHRDAPYKKHNGVKADNGHFYKTDNALEIGKPCFYEAFGNTTEGTERTRAAWHIPGWTSEGINEAANYRLKSEYIDFSVSSEEFKLQFAKGNPLRIDSGPHVVALVGYNSKIKEFKYVNSWGDGWGTDGYGTFSFDAVDNGLPAVNDSWKIDSAHRFGIIPPKPVPVARIKISHTNRNNVNMWLYAESSPLLKKKIWPQEWSEHNSARNLHYTVRLPHEFIWPPNANNRIILEIYDSGEYTRSGGVIEEFTLAFGSHILSYSSLSKGKTVTFREGQSLCLSIP